MQKIIHTCCFLLLTYIAYAQNFSLGVPDSAKNIIVPNGLVSYNIQNPLGQNANGFVNSPIAVLINPNNKSNQLYFYDLDLNVPAGAIITGVEVEHARGGCNSGSYTIDSFYLAYNNMIISDVKRDSASASMRTTSGSSSDLWGANLTDAIVNDHSFGIILQSSTTGICTYGQFDLQVKIHYILCNPIEAGTTPDSAKNITAPNGLVSYNIQNPLGHNANGFVNSPIAVLINPNAKSHYLYFYDLDLNIPAGAVITGVKAVHAHGGCNSGSYTIDSLYLAHNGAIISDVQRDSASASTRDTLGGENDLWGANLTSAMVNDNSFGVILQSTTTGICTFGQFDLQISVYYCITPSSIQETEQTALRVFPNPAESYLQVETDYPIAGKYYKIYNYTGHCLLQGMLSDSKNSIDIQSLNTGFYILNIEGNSFKFMKE